MASPWALERFGGLTGALSRLLPQALGSALEKAFARRATARTKPDQVCDDQRQALRHVVTFTANSNQGLLDMRWGEASITERPRC
jgi:hypothetical protein